MYHLLVGALTFLAMQGNPSTVITGISVSDVDIGDGEMLMSLSVAKGRITLAKIDGLTFTVGDGLDDATMTFAGKLVAVNAAMATITYVVNDGVAGLDELLIVANDQGFTGEGGPQTASKAVQIAIPQMNSPPVVVIPPITKPPQEDTPKTIAGIKIVDQDAGTAAIRVSIALSQGTLRLSKTTGLTFVEGENGQKSMAFAGTLASINAALATVTYMPPPNYSGPDVMAIVADDQGNTGLGGAKSATAEWRFDVVPMNDAPGIDAPVQARVASF